MDAQSYCKVTVRIEPLDGSAGMEIEAKRAKFSFDLIETDRPPIEILPGVIVSGPSEIERIDFQIQAERDQNSQVSFELRPI
jgi:hypothetical protein